jgi:lipopolysaccharide/colanic/teichoic acid biosynthesis glycosyltransferase
MYSFFKRMLDIIVSAIGIVALAPIFVVISIAIKLTSPGPILFIQSRVGKGGQKYLVLKFRTMHVDAENKLKEHLATAPEAGREWQVAFKLTSDPRITGVGRFLRRTGLDELPQLFNVLRGDMSLVGPRAALYHEFMNDPPRKELLNRVRPGLAGPWIPLRHDRLNRDQILDIELRYAEKPTFRKDIAILGRVIVEGLAGHRGSY